MQISRPHTKDLQLLSVTHNQPAIVSRLRVFSSAEAPSRRHLYSNSPPPPFQARFIADIFQQWRTENQSHGELNQKGNNWSINDQVTTRHWLSADYSPFSLFRGKAATRCLGEALFPRRRLDLLLRVCACERLLGADGYFRGGPGWRTCDTHWIFFFKRRKNRTLGWNLLCHPWPHKPKPPKWLCTTACKSDPRGRFNN